MRPRLEVVPWAGGTAQGAGGSGLGRTGEYSAMLATAACHCGPGQFAGQKYTCVTCAGFALIARRIAARAPHLPLEQRRWRI
jgi:hypothetical protein